MTESLSAAVDATAAGRAACEIGCEYGFWQLANVGLLCSACVCVWCVCVGLCLTILVGCIF